MKHLKKLSVVLMLTTLFSVTFTSCIDNEVSPVVEAIYEAQADLIAAQANVQNAEATKLEAEAAYQLALAAGANADAAYTLEQVEELRIENAAAQIVVDEAQAQFNIDLAFLVAELEEAGAQIALDYALKYRMYANAATDLLDDKADAVYDLALAQAQANSSLPLYVIQQLETVIANAQFQVEVNEAEIAALQALIDNPNSLPAQVTAWEAEQDALEIARDLKQAEVDAKYAERDNLVAGTDGEDAVRDDFIDEYEGYVADSLQLSTDIKDFQDDIDDWSAALATYDADLAAAEAAITVAETNYDNAWLALGDEVAFDGYYTDDADGDPIAIGGVKYDPATNLQEEYVNARIDYLDAEDAYDTYESDFAALVSTYNDAAAELAAQQLAFDGNTYAADLTDAESDLTDAEGDLTDAQDAYSDAHAAFLLDPAGSVVTDGPFVAVTDLGYLGLDDLSAVTYMRVASWVESPLLSGNYVPNTFEPTKYTPATLATYLTSVYALDGDPYVGGEVGATYAISDDTEVVIWDQDGTSTDAAGNPTTLPTNGTYLINTEVANTVSVVGNIDINIAYFVEVESDDSSVPTVFTFNVATNMLGTDNFSDRSFTTDEVGDITYPTWEAMLTDADTDAGYDTTWDGDILNAQTNDALTAQAALWNAKLAVAKAQYAFDNGSVLLDAAQDAFDYQQELFDFGVANLALLADDLAIADSAQDDAQEAVDQAWLKLGDEYPAGDVGDTKKTTSTVGAWYYVNFISGTKALTLNAVVFNAEVTLADLEDCDEVCLQTSIDAAQHEIDLIQPALDGILAIIAEMQAQYDTYMETYVSGVSTSYANLDADLKVIYDALSFEIFKLEQELTALDAQYDSVTEMLLWSGGDNLNDISLDIELAMLYDNSQGSYLDSINDLKLAEDALAAALAGNAEDAALIEYYQSVVDVLEQRYQNALALAAKYKALMEAALAS